MVKDTVVAGLNRQIQQELTAAHNYLALSVWFEEQLLKGFAAYMKKQASEEREHADRLMGFVQDRGGKVQLGAIEAPRTQFANALEAVKHARDLERQNTALIHSLYQTAAKEGDLPTQQHLQWFIQEQVEEEKWTEDFVAMAEKIGDHVGALFMWDHRVGKLVEGKE